MDDDGFAMQGRRRRGTFREPASDRGLDSFLREVPKYSGTNEDYAEEHARRYGREEGLAPDGRHRPGNVFPPGSNRQKMHERYDNSTEARNFTRDAYNDELLSAQKELKKMSNAEQRYYAQQTGGLPPHQHERLEPRAAEFRDKSWK